MHWNATPHRSKRKTIRKFALIPRRCENNHIHWLETVAINKRLIGDTYSTVTAYDDYSPDTCWCNCNIPTPEPKLND